MKPHQAVDDRDGLERGEPSRQVTSRPSRGGGEHGTGRRLAGVQGDVVHPQTTLGAYAGRGWAMTCTSSV
ncbi:hypothetical protein ACQP2F_44195 [Actinoplanes sp. CA-030573]|uniref:hypothetical protein n=1 Tax=Actinoplanes sp. CA-030573 TaxID=3239898 RepID=UPI003D94BBC2